MAWMRKFISRLNSPGPEDADANAGATVPSDLEANGVTQPSSSPDDAEPVAAGMLPATTRMTGHQGFYIFFMDGIVAMILSGGINFAVAYGKHNRFSSSLRLRSNHLPAMYTTQDLAARPIRLFQLPNTLAGDAGVTIIIQCLITWLAEYFLVNRDLRQGTVAPAAFFPEPKGPMARRLLLLDMGTSASVPSLIFAHVARAMLIAVASFIVMWPAAIGILTVVGTRSGGDWVFEATWAPQLFKLVFGGVLALLTTPLLAMFWLAKAGWSSEVIEEDGEAAEP